jgi:hypothetical protein
MKTTLVFLVALVLALAVVCGGWKWEKPQASAASWADQASPDASWSD